MVCLPEALELPALQRQVVLVLHLQAQGQVNAQRGARKALSLLEEV
jgi:hypothetical protein